VSVCVDLLGSRLHVRERLQQFPHHHVSGLVGDVQYLSIVPQMSCLVRRQGDNLSDTWSQFNFTKDAVFTSANNRLHFLSDEGRVHTCMRQYPESLSLALVE
jgi:hypothetical protein